MGGEKVTLDFCLNDDWGSPPHGRGKGTEKAACADVYADHPRMGGEKVQILLYEDIQKGSPPHGRGKDSSPVSISTALRITPAWAGKRSG